MHMNVVRSRSLAILAGAVTAAVLASATLYATTYTTNGVTLDVPSYTQANPLLHCEPQNDATADDITLSGIPAGSTVRLNFTLSSGVAGGPLTNVSQTFTNQSGTVSYTIPYPESTSDWPYNDGTNRAIVVSVSAAVTTSTGVVIAKIAAKPWKVVCTPDVPEEPGEPAGCTPGYWRQVGDPYANNDQHLHSWLDTPYRPGDDYEAVFGVEVDAIFAPHALGDAVWLRGNADNEATIRHSVAALMNAAHPDVNYPMNVGEVIQAVQDAFSGARTFASVHAQFESYNEIGCDLN